MYLFENYFSDKMYGFKYGGYLYGLKEETKINIWDNLNNCNILYDWQAIVRHPSKPLYAPLERALVDFDKEFVTPKFAHPKIFVLTVKEFTCKQNYIPGTIPTELPSTTNTSPAKKTTELKTSSLTLLLSLKCFGFKNLILPWVLNNHLVIVKTKNGFEFDMQVRINARTPGKTKEWNWFIIEFIPEKMYQSIIYFYYNNAGTLFVHNGFN